jgi:serine/threonine-protein kinase
MHRTLLLLASFVLVAPTMAQDLGADVRALFKKHCHECHGGKKTAAKLDVLSHKILLDRKVLVPGRATESEVYVRLVAKDDSIMPPPESGKLSAAEIALVKAWIDAGAPEPHAVRTTSKFVPIDPVPRPSAETPEDLGIKHPLGAGYTLQAIANDVQRLPESERPFQRYLSLTHLLGGGTTQEELIQHREALARVVNYLSWKPKLVAPVPVESTHTVFRIDLRTLGWDKKLTRKEAGKPAASSYNLYDLALLEYPYGVVFSMPAYQTLCREYLAQAGMVRPIPFVRADWFVSVVTQPPLYHDFLQLPLQVEELERSLGVNAQGNINEGRAIRGGVINSGVSRNNRVNERHPAKFGAYWKSFDFKSSRAQENIFFDPLNLNASGGEMIFNLPNGLQGYFVTDEKGRRIDAAPTNIVVDTFASDKVVRNGLSCMRCHDKGMKDFADVVRPILQKLKTAPFDIPLSLRIYRDQTALDAYLAADRKRFENALKGLLGRDPGGEPIRLVSRRFLDDRLTLSSASAELGLAQPKNLAEILARHEFVSIGLAPLAAGQPLARDAWDAYYDRVFRMLNLGTPLPPLDGLIRGSYDPDVTPPFSLEVKTNKKGNTFQAKDEMIVFVKPGADVYLEVVATSAAGKKTILAPSSTRVKAGQTWRFPPEGKSLKVPAGTGQEQITVIASTAPFAAGEIHGAPGVADRLIHPHRVILRGSGIEVQVAPSAVHTIKRTLTIETR